MRKAKASSEPSPQLLVTTPFEAFLFVLQQSGRRERQELHCQIPETCLVFGIMTITYS